MARAFLAGQRGGLPALLGLMELQHEGQSPLFAFPHAGGGAGGNSEGQDGGA
jgi:hypothetical protein